MVALVVQVGGDRRARLDDQLLRGFVEAHEWALRIVRSLIDFQDVFMVATNAALASGGITHCCLRCGWNVFFSVRPMVFAGTLDNAQFDLLLGDELHLANQRGRRGSRGCRLLRRASRNAPPGGIWCSCGPTPPRTLPRPAGAWSARQWRCWCPGRGDPAVAPAFTASDTSGLSRIAAFVSNWAERLPLRINSLSRSRSSASSLTTYFLTAVSPPTGEAGDLLLAATDQKFPS